MTRSDLWAYISFHYKLWGANMSVKKELPSLRILIVEDNVDIAENIAYYLEVQGHVLDFAMDGIGGLTEGFHEA